MSGHWRPGWVGGSAQRRGHRKTQEYQPLRAMKHLSRRPRRERGPRGQGQKGFQEEGTANKAKACRGIRQATGPWQQQSPPQTQQAQSPPAGAALGCLPHGPRPAGMVPSSQPLLPGSPLFSHLPEKESLSMAGRSRAWYM